MVTLTALWMLGLPLLVLSGDLCCSWLCNTVRKKMAVLLWETIAMVSGGGEERGGEGRGEEV